MGTPLIAILMSVMCSSAAHFFLKVGAGALGRTYSPNHMILVALTNGWIWLGTLLHVTALGLWIVALSKSDLSYAYPFIALGFVLTTLASGWWLHEPVTSLRWAGIGLIVAGVLVVARS